MSKLANCRLTAARPRTSTKSDIGMLWLLMAYARIAANTRIRSVIDVVTLSQRTASLREI